MYRVGLTGGIASGKSTVSKFFQAKNVPILDADKAARIVVAPGSEGLAAIEAAFGTDVITKEGTLDRQALAKIIFSDAEKRKKLNSIMHSRIWAQLISEEKNYAEEGYTAVLFDVPLLMETKWHEKMDEVWLVCAEDELRIERLMQRDHITKEECIERIASQMQQSEKEKYAQIIIDNSGDENELTQRLTRLWEEKGFLFRKEAR